LKTRSLLSYLKEINPIGKKSVEGGERRKKIGRRREKRERRYK
jgi:hypothetical protein